MVTNVSIIVAIPILVRTVERVNLPKVTREGTHAAVALTTVGIGVNCIIIVILTLAEIMGGVQIVQGAHEDTHATAGMAIMDINVSIRMHVYLLLAITRELALEATTATHAAVDQALPEPGVKKELETCASTSKMVTIYRIWTDGLQAIVIHMSKWKPTAVMAIPRLYTQVT
jgi:hypothetical protein